MMVDDELVVGGVMAPWNWTTGQPDWASAKRHTMRRNGRRVHRIPLKQHFIYQKQTRTSTLFRVPMRHIATRGVARSPIQERLIRGLSRTRWLAFEPGPNRP